MERQEGYYWVKWNGRFVIAEWLGGEWDLGGPMFDSDFEYINENRIKAPGELPD